MHMQTTPPSHVHGHTNKHTSTHSTAKFKEIDKSNNENKWNMYKLIPLTTVPNITGVPDGWGGSPSQTFFQLDFFSSSIQGLVCLCFNRLVEFLICKLVGYEAWTAPPPPPFFSSSITCSPMPKISQARLCRNNTSHQNPTIFSGLKA